MEEVSQNPLPEEESAPAEKETQKETKKRPRESIFGILLLGAIVFFLLLTAAGIGWAVYGGVSKNQAAKNELSITGLGNPPADEANSPEGESPETAPAPSPGTAPSPETSGTKTTAVSVLNGGSAGGSAGKLATALKAEGYTQVTAGDAVGNYTGVAIYYAANLGTEAEALKTAVAKTYPNVTVSPAVASNAETSRSPLTVILGR